MKEFELGHAGDIGISKSKIFEMKRPNKYDFDFSEDYESNLETYCDELEKALDKACKRLESFDEMSYCPPEKHWSKEKWKEWCMKL